MSFAATAVAVATAISTINTVASLVQQGLPIAEALWKDAEAEFNNLKVSAVIAPATVAADDAALDAADAALQAAEPAAPPGAPAAAPTGTS